MMMIAEMKICMGNDPHHAVPLGQPVQGLHGLVQSLFVQGAEALVHEHGIQPDAPA